MKIYLKLALMQFYRSMRTTKQDENLRNICFKRKRIRVISYPKSKIDMEAADNN